MELRHKEMLALLKISSSTWKHTKDKNTLFNRQGFKLLETKKVGRTNIYVIEEPQKASEQLKWLLLNEYDFNINSDNLVSFSNLLLMYWQQGAILDTQLVSETLGISKQTIYRWRKQMEEKGLITIVPRNTVVLYYRHDKRIVGTEKDWTNWKNYAKQFPLDNYSEVLFMYRDEYGFFPYRTSTIEFNVIKEDIFKLIYKLTKEI